MNKKQMIEEAMGRIMYVQQLQENYMTCLHALQRKNKDFNGDDRIYTSLMEWELEEWRGLLMWGLIADQDIQDRIKAATRERFLSEKHHVANWFHNGENPKKWLSADEEEFREMIRKEFQPKES